MHSHELLFKAVLYLTMTNPIKCCI